MGSDDIFRKLKRKATQNKKREHNKREPYPKFLVVCEDTVSGYHYLLKAKNHYKLSTANFHVVGLGRDPLSIVNLSFTTGKNNLFFVQFGYFMNNFQA